MRALALLALCLQVSGLGAQVTSIGPAARRIDYLPGSGVLVASQTLRGSSFARLEGMALGPVLQKPDWPTLVAEEVGNNRMILGDRHNQLRLVEVSVDAERRVRLAELARWPVPAPPIDVVYRDGFLHVALGGSGVYTYQWNAASLDTPALRSRYPFVDYSKEIRFNEQGVLFLADNLDTGMQVLEMSDVLRPRMLATRTHGFIETVDVSGWLVVIGDRTMGYHLYDCRSVSEPRLAGFIALPRAEILRVQRRASIARSVELDERGHLLVADGPGGARLFEVKPGEPLTTTLKAAWNPGNQGAADAIFIGIDRVAIATEAGGIAIHRMPP